MCKGKTSLEVKLPFCENIGDMFIFIPVCEFIPSSMVPDHKFYKFDACPKITKYETRKIYSVNNHVLNN